VKTKAPHLLRFTHGNAKLADSIMIFSLPTGYTCPGARECLAKANRHNGKLRDGKHMRIRCYAATQESAFPSVRKVRWHNLEQIRPLNHSVGAMRRLIRHSIEQQRRHKTRHVRIHGAGDFFSQNYFDAWMWCAIEMPDLEFYAYTKSLPFWVGWQHDRQLDLPPNMTLIASRGGQYDELIRKYGFVEVVVVRSPEEALALGLEIDHDDRHAQDGTKNFSLLIHGGQKPGTDASAATKDLRDRGIEFGYSSKNPKLYTSKV